MLPKFSGDVLLEDSDFPNIAGRILSDKVPKTTQESNSYYKG